ncbi:MAG: alpha/beta fold hydrolase [Flavobacteriales bacterium]
MSVDLFYRREGHGTPVVVLHGLFGSSDNFGSIGRELSAEFDMVLVDERDHGRSPHTDRITYPLMAEDVHALAVKLGLKDIVLVGHSMGGKTAMTFAQRWPELLKHLVVIDIGPREYPIGDHAAILEALTTSDVAHKESRKEVEAHLSTYVPEPGVVQFLMKSLYWEKLELLGWRFNVPLLARDINDILAAMGPETVRVPTLFIRGGKSGYITREDQPQIKEQFPNSRIETVPFAGHWVHAQAPEEVMDFIRSVA